MIYSTAGHNAELLKNCNCQFKLYCGLHYIHFMDATKSTVVKYQEAAIMFTLLSKHGVTYNYMYIFTQEYLLTLLS